MEKAKLESLKSRLIEMRARLIGEVQDIDNAIQETLSPPGENSNYHTHLADMGASGASGLDREIILAENEAGILQQVEDALRRIEEGSYGICENCRQPINPERLEAIPYTRYCVKCSDEAAEENPPGVSKTPFRSKV